VRIVAIRIEALSRRPVTLRCFTIKLSRMNAWDAARLSVLSKGDGNGSDADEALARSIAFAEAAFLAPLPSAHKKTVAGGRKKRGQPRK
jgi:hypothetical protein